MQLLLPIHQVDQSTLENFFPENNLLLLNSLRKNFDHVQQPFFFIWGFESAGKSHLLQAITTHFILQNKTASYIPLAKSEYFSAMVLDNLDLQQVVCIDDLDFIAGNLEWEIAIFNLMNKIKDSGKTLLLLSAQKSPTALKISLPDLQSRLSWGEVYQLIALNDQQKIIVLQRHAHYLGIELPIETASFLLNHLERDIKNLFTILETLNKASLQANRRLTIPFVKEALTYGKT